MELKPATQMAAALDRLWTRFLPDLCARVAILESASQALASGTLTAAEREEAAGAAHRLAGVLGTFSLERGTAVARELELRYASGNWPSPEAAAQMAQELRQMIEGRGTSATG